jgi:hypothetical protein
MVDSKVVAGAVCVFSAVVGCWPANAAAYTPHSVIIYNNHGGRLLDYALRVQKAREKNQFVQIKGKCASACTLYLSLPRDQLCLTPGAGFRFHKPYGSSASMNKVASRLLMNAYPDWVRHWVVERGGLRTRLLTMEYAYAAQYLPTCIGVGKNVAATPDV